jgi:hypothetical protein
VAATAQLTPGLGKLLMEHRGDEPRKEGQDAKCCAKSLQSSYAWVSRVPVLPS